MELPDLPVIFCMVLDPLRHSLKTTNMTGIRLEVPIDRQLSILHALLPGAKRLGLLYDQRKTAPLVEEAKRKAKGLGVDLVTKSVSSEKDVPGALRSILPQIDAF